MVMARVVGKDGNGLERNLSADESIAGVIALNPDRLSDVLAGLNFNDVRGIPSQVTRLLGERRIGTEGVTYELIEIKPKKPELVAVKNPVGSQRDWSRGGHWLARHLLEIVEFISYGKRFDIKYALAQSPRLKEQTGSIKLTHLQSNKKVKTLKIKGDEAVVGKYLGGQTEVLLIRTGSKTATVVYPNGTKRNIAINLTGILVDDININSFSSTPSTPVEEEPSNPSKGGKNPVCVGTADSRQHLLYKPVSDTMGTVVLVFDSIYQKEFRAVKIELKDGTFAEGWWKTLVLWGNPDAGGMRQHWRTNVKASEIKDKALIIVDDTNQECRFQIPGSSRTRWE